MGTASYMSPEQAEGKKLDARTDLFSLGAVLYEMATGKQAFSGDTSAIVRDAILNRAPVSPARLNPELPAELERIIDKALEKDRDVRYQVASELRGDLKRLKRDASSGRSAAGAVAQPFPRKRWPLVLAGLVALIAASGLVWFATHRGRPSGLTAKVFPLTGSLGGEFQPALSPDGTEVAYIRDVESRGKGNVYVKLIGAGAPLRLTFGTQDEASPAWSPDGRYIAFLRESHDGSRLRGARTNTAGTSMSFRRSADQNPG